MYIDEYQELYKELCDRESIHCVRLINSSDNLKIAERLKELKYISSYKTIDNDRALSLRLKKRDS